MECQSLHALYVSKLKIHPWLDFDLIAPLPISPHCFLPLIATMLDLPEMLDKVCQLLGRDDLMRCALVSSAWHSIVIPHLWRDLSWISSRRSRDAFRMLVLEDYLAEQQRRERQEKGQDIEQARVPLLSKYGQWIRLLPSATKDPSPKTSGRTRQSTNSTRIVLSPVQTLSLQCASTIPSLRTQGL